MPKSTYDDFWRRIAEKINVAAGGTPTIQARKGKKQIKGLQVIHGLTAHVFRHNYATMLYYAGVPVKDAQILMGHSNIKITLDIYTHLDKNKSNVAEKLNSISAL
jgi:integrase